MTPHRPFRAWMMVGLLAVLAPLALSTPARAQGKVAADQVKAEYLYSAGDRYLHRRVQEVRDTQDVLLAMEWTPTVDGSVDGARICLDLTPPEVNARLPLFAYLWNSDGVLLAFGGAYEGISHTGPCFYDVGFTSVPVTGGQHYVVGFWVRGGQYSYVPWGFGRDRTNASGHIVGLSNANSTIGEGNGLFAYTSLIGTAIPFPAQSYQQSDYLVSPRFTPATPAG